LRGWDSRAPGKPGFPKVSSEHPVLSLKIRFFNFFLQSAINILNLQGKLSFRRGLIKDFGKTILIIT
jgi:hypothetical protein